MKKKETPGLPEPTREELKRELDRIEESTFEEEYERKRRGKSQEPEAIHAPKMPSPNKLWPKDSDIEKAEFINRIKKWQEENRGYVLKDIDPNQTEIMNITKIKFPLELLDFLVNKASIVLGERGGIKVLGRIKQIKISAASSTGGITIFVRDEKGIDGKLIFENKDGFPLYSYSKSFFK